MPEYTPMMTHYLEIKKKNPDALVFYRLGDFYEMFFDDAKTASQELDLYLTGRNAGVEEKVPMCGVPYHAVTSYIQRLVSKGYKVAIVEQMEDPADAVGLVKRDVIRIVTPGTIMDESFDLTSVYLASVEDFNYGYVLAICEITTGETKIIPLRHDNTILKQAILDNEIRELVVSSCFNQAVLKGLENIATVTVSICDDETITDNSKEVSKLIDDVHTIKAINRLMNYLEITQKRVINHLTPFEIVNDANFLAIDYSTALNLELVHCIRQSEKQVTLFSFLDKTKSAAGSRELKKWINKPLRDLERINQRLDFITYLNKHIIEREQLKESLSNIYDIERIVSRVSYGNANGRDILRLQKSLEVVPSIIEIVKKSEIYPKYDNVDSCDELYQKIKNSIVEEPPVSTNQGGIFKDGYNSQLDELRKIQKEGQTWIASLEQKEKDRTGIKTLKIGYNRVFGYYIEISKGALSLVKDEWGYQRKQTLTTGERFITSELKEKEDLILHSEEKAIRLETQLFNDLIELVKQHLVKLQHLANYLAKVDALYALSVISNNQGYVRPTFNRDGLLDIKAGRHPILETICKDGYVSNDVYLDNKQSIQIITGPNMGGKSTYMRQAALLVIIAQIGCFVPAKSMNTILFDKLFTRVGANDDILSGQSTFMVEMNEANNALQNATKDSLIIFDEIGRGTATYDGMALAQSMLEYISVALQAKTLFSTHYHELTNLENNLSNVINKHVDVYEEDDNITFLYKVKNGKANKSYGIHVASLAKLPEAVIDRSKQLLKEFESSKKTNNDQSQLLLVEKVPSELKEIEQTLKLVDPNSITPIEALQLVANLKEKLGGKHE